MSPEPPAADDAPGPGTVLGGRYRLVRLLGEGGMGRVFLAEDEREGGRVAVKVLADDRPIPKAKERFEREARAIARIDHPNVVRVTEVGQSPRGGVFYVMEHLEGEELATTLEREGSMKWPRARHFTLQICDALQAAHDAGIVHRDLKLENCFRVTRGDDPDFVKILDFGLVKLLSPDPDDGGGRLTNTGATMGTPAYMAPELCRGKEVDHRVDVYALGVMLYELLAGHVPFQGDGFLDVALKHMNEPPPPLSDYLPPADLPPGLEAAVMVALAKAREDRFPSMAAFAEALRGVSEPAEAEDVPQARPPVISGATEPALPATDSIPIRREGTVVAPITVRGDDAAATASSAVRREGTVVAPITVRSEEAAPADSSAVRREGTAVAPIPASLSASLEDAFAAASSAALSGATEPSLSGVGRIEPVALASSSAPPRSRAAWPWLAIGGAAAAGLVAWWMAASPPRKPPREAEAAPAVSVVEREPSEPAPVPVAPPTPPAGTAQTLPAPAPGPEEAPVDVAAPEPAAGASTGSGLTARQISTALDRLQPQVRRCANARTGGRPGERVRVVLVVDRSTGRVVSAAASDARHRAAVDRCMQAVLRKAEFPAGGRGTQTIKRTVLL